MDSRPLWSSLIPTIFGSINTNTILIPNDVAGMVLKDDLMPIRAWREYLKLTQTEVAERLGITQAAYAQIENARRPRKSTLRRVAACFGLALEQLDI